MDARYFGLIEIVLMFGAVLGFCLWQLRSIRRSIAEDKARGEASAEPPAPTTRRSAEDVFRDTVTRKRGSG